jgi:hypothetical protein
LKTVYSAILFERFLRAGRATRPLHDVRATFFGRVLRLWPLEFPMSRENAKKRMRGKKKAISAGSGAHARDHVHREKSGRPVQPVGSGSASQSGPAGQPARSWDRPTTPGSANGPNPFARREKSPQVRDSRDEQTTFFLEKEELKFLSQKKCRLLVARIPYLWGFLTTSKRDWTRSGPDRVQPSPKLETAKSGHFKNPFDNESL